MSYHHLRAPRPAVAPPAVPQLGPVTLALRAVRDAVEAPRRTGPVTDAIRTMRAAVPHFDADPDVRALRRALTDHIESDLAVLDMLGGDADLEGDYATVERATDGTTFTRGRTTDDEWSIAEGELEDEHDGREPDDEGELSLGSLCGTAAGCDENQVRWPYGGHADLELDDVDLEDGHDAEGLTDDNGIADQGGLHEQRLRHMEMGGQC